VLSTYVGREPGELIIDLDAFESCLSRCVARQRSGAPGTREKWRVDH
jgi:hypothetical protein